MTSVEIKRPLPHRGNEIEILTQRLENFNIDFTFDEQRTSGKTFGRVSESNKEKKVNINCTKSKNIPGKNESNVGIETVYSSKIKDDSKKDKEIKKADGEEDQAKSVATILNVKQVAINNKNDNKEKEILQESVQHANDVAVKLAKNAAVISEEEKNIDDSKKVLTPDRIEESKPKVDEEDLERDNDTEQCDVIPRGGRAEKTKKEVKPYDRTVRQQQICQNPVGGWNVELHGNRLSCSEQVFDACNLNYMVGGSVQVNPCPIFQPQVVQTKPFQNFIFDAPAGNMYPRISQNVYPQSMLYQPQVQNCGSTYQQQASTLPTSAYKISQSNPVPSSYIFMQHNFPNPRTPPQELMFSPKPGTPDFYEDAPSEDQLVKGLPVDGLIPIHSNTSLDQEQFLDEFVSLSEEDKKSFFDLVNEDDKESLVGVSSPSSGYFSHKGDEDSSDAGLQADESVRTSDPVISNQCMHHHRAVNSPLQVYMAHVCGAGLVSPNVEQDNVVAHRNCALLTNEQLKKLDEDLNSLLIEVVIKCSDKFLKPLLDRYARSGFLLEFINKPNKQKRAPLHYVVHSNDPKKVRLLVERGADVNAQDISRIYNSGSAKLKRQSLIGYVASQGERCLPVLAELLCSPDADLSNCDSEGCTPLHTAILSHNINGIDSRKTVFHLILRGANINAQNSLNSKTPLQCAVEKGDIVLVSHLFDVVRRVYHNDGTKIRSMVQPGFPLLKAAFDLEFQDQTHRLYLIELLLKQGAELTQKGSDAALRKEFMQIPGIAEVMKSLAADKRRMQK